MNLRHIIEKNEKFIAVFLLLVFTLQNVLASFYLSPTADEPKHIARGYTYLKTGDQRFLSFQPLLINTLNALPLLFIKVNLPLEHSSWTENNVIEFAWQVFFRSGNDPEQIFALSRITTFLLSIILGIVVYLWASKLYGTLSGLFALFLYCFSITILSMASLVTNDLGATLTMFSSVFALWLFYKKPSVKRLLLSGFVFGLALISKYYALFFVPSVIILFCVAYFKAKPMPVFFKIRDKKKRNVANIAFLLFLFFFVSWVTVNISYKFDGTFRSVEYNINHDPGLDKSLYPKFVEKSASFIPLKKETSIRVVESLASNVPILLPYHYLKGALVTAEISSVRSSEGFYFFEEVLDSPPKYYYIVMFFLKVQIPLLILIFLTMCLYKKIKKSPIDDFFLWIPIIIFFLMFLLLNSIANGFRHLLPIFPFLLVFVSKIANVKIKNKRAFYCIASLLALWYALGSLIAFPFYIPYYNELVGMDNGHKVSVRVDVDWGQDLKLLKKWMDKNEIKKVFLSYYGQVQPEAYNISYEYLPSIGIKKYPELSFDSSLNMKAEANCTPVQGIIAISIGVLKETYYLQNQSCFNWLDNLKPIDRVGYTIYIYNVTRVK